MKSLLSVLLCCVSLVVGEGLEDGELVLRLQHSFDMGSSWVERGVVTIHSTRSASTEEPAGAATVDQASLDLDQRTHLKNLCGESGLYLVRATLSSQPDFLRSYTSACALLEANLQDTLTLQLDWRGKLTALSLGLQLPQAAKTVPGGGVRLEVHSKKEDSSVFKTRVSTQQMENGPVPDTAAFIQRVEENKRKEEKGEVKDNRSFLAKYWMYIVPVVLFMAVNGAASPAQ